MTGIHYIKNISNKTLRELYEEIKNPDPRLFIKVFKGQVWLCMRRE